MFSTGHWIVRCWPLGGILLVTLLPLTRGASGPAASTAAVAPAGPGHPAERHERVGVAALVLPNIRGNKGQALARIEAYVRRAADQGAKIVVTPETVLGG